MTDFNSKKLDDLIEKVEISIQQKSAHDSDMKKSLDELSSRFTDFKQEVQPVLDAFKQGEETKIVFDRFGKASFRWAKWTTVIGGGLYVIWKLFTFIINQARL